MRDSWEFALNHARGDYVIFIGDDDAIMPGAIQRMEELLHQEPCPIYFWDAPIYRWPMEDAPASIVYLPNISHSRRIALRSLAMFSLRWGGHRYMRLPLLYHSLVSNELLQQIRRRTGRFFHSTQPDVFMAFALPALCDEAMKLGEFLTVYGESVRKVALGAENFHISGFSAKLGKFVREYDSYRLHPTLYPRVPIWVNLIPDAILVAKDLFGEFYGETSFNYSAMWAFMCRYWKWGHIVEIVRMRREISVYHPFNAYLFVMYSILHKLSDWRIAGRARLRGRGNSVARVPDNVLGYAEHAAAWQRERVQPRRPTWRGVGHDSVEPGPR
jgi:glycosyltransferase involved in cell wall biosynthesis